MYQDIIKLFYIHYFALASPLLMIDVVKWKGTKGPPPNDEDNEDNHVCPIAIILKSERAGRKIRRVNGDLKTGRRGN